MKKLLIILLSVFAAALTQAEPFGYVDGYESDNNYQNFGLYKISHNMPINYYIIEGKQDRPAKPADAYQSALRESIAIDMNAQMAVASAFDEWISAVHYYIDQAGRSEEFADITSALKKPRLRKVAYAEHADIIFEFTSLKEIQKKCGTAALGCFNRRKIWDIIPSDKRAVFGNLNTKDAFEIIVPYVEYGYLKNGKAGSQSVHLILLHELGHFMALADQYYNPWYDNIKKLKTPWRLEMEEALMSGTGHKISCDEVDGVISLLDYNFMREHNGIYPARAQKGWKSFCDETLYKNGEVVSSKNAATKMQELTNYETFWPRHPSNSYK